jgi:hypothetical protein
MDMLRPARVFFMHEQVLLPVAAAITKKQRLIETTTMNILNLF